jgi:hypothetical protein
MTLPIDASTEAVLAKLAKDRFRAKFRLYERERAFALRWSIEKVMRDAADIFARRIAMAEPPNDGKQTPWRNHPVFIAQHATATCCRRCIEKWHSIPRGRPLDPVEFERLLSIVHAWIEKDLRRNEP